MTELTYRVIRDNSDDRTKRVVIVVINAQAFMGVYKNDDQWRMLHQTLPDEDETRYLKLYQADKSTNYTNVYQAKYEAFAAFYGPMPRMNPKPLAWIAFTQLIYMGMMLLPGVQFVGTLYTIIAQVAVMVATFTNNAPYVMTATRLSTAVVIGNALLSFLMWQSAVDTLDQISAAFRSAVIIVSGFFTISTNQFLSDLSQGPAFAEQKSS